MRIWEALLMGVIPIGDASSLADRMLQAEGYPLASARGRLGAYFGGSSRHVHRLPPRVASDPGGGDG